MSGCSDIALDRQMTSTITIGGRTTSVGMGLRGPPGRSAGGGEYPVGAAVSGHRVLVLRSDGTVIHADVSTPAHAHAVIGISTQAADVDGFVVIASDGETVIEPSWSWTPGAPLFLGSNGQLTHAAGPGLFCLCVAVALSATRILVSIEEPTFY